MRDTAGNALVMNGDAPYPLLRPEGVDASVAFDPTSNTVKLVSPDTNEDRDMTVRDITSSGNVYANNLRASGDMQANTFSASGSMYANGDMFAVNFRATGQTTCNNLGANSANLGPLTAADTQLGKLTCNTIRATGDITLPGLTISTDPNGVMRSLNYYGGTFHGVWDNTSDARLKHRHAPLDDAALDQLLAAPVDSWEYRSDVEGHGTLPAGRRVGMVAQNAPAMLQREGDGGYLELDQASTVGMLHALVKRLAAELDDTRARLTALEDST